MNPSAGRYKGKPTAEPIMLKRTGGESPLLQELLPKATLQRASALANDDKEVLIYLIKYGLRAILTESASLSACKSPWKPWKLSSMASKKEQVFSSCPFSDSCTKSSVVGEEVSSRRNLWLLANHEASSTCDCFSCYSRFWSRWNGSPNRDLINEILDIVEESPKNSKVKKKKRADKKRGVEGSAWKSSGGDSNLHNGTVQMPSLEGFTDMQIADNTPRDGNLHAGISTDDAPKNVAQTLRSGRKKSMFGGAKQKEEASVTNLKSNKASGAAGLEEEKSLATSVLVGGSSNGMDAAVHMEVSAGSFTTEASEVMAASLSPALLSLSAKNTPVLHRIAKRRHSQVIPLDDEGLSDMEREQEAATTVESTQAPMSPRAADIGLGGRGLLARVFPDALGRVATRLWDLVSVRLRSRTVEYH